MNEETIKDVSDETIKNVSDETKEVTENTSFAELPLNDFLKNFKLGEDIKKEYNINGNDTTKKKKPSLLIKSLLEKCDFLSTHRKKQHSPELERMKELNRILCRGEKFVSLKSKLVDYSNEIQRHSDEIAKLTKEQNEKIRQFMNNNNDIL